MINKYAFKARINGKVMPLRASRVYDGLQILLVEDDESNQRLISHILTKNGMRVDIVTNGVDALLAIAGTTYDVILMDLILPGQSGYELTGLIRDQGSGLHVWILALTACAMPEDRKRCLESGMDAYLSKPFRHKELIALIQKLNNLNKTN